MELQKERRFIKISYISTCIIIITSYTFFCNSRFNWSFKREYYRIANSSGIINWIEIIRFICPVRRIECIKFISFITFLLYWILSCDYIIFLFKISIIIYLYFWYCKFYLYNKKLWRNRLRRVYKRAKKKQGNKGQRWWRSW